MKFTLELSSLLTILCISNAFTGISRYNAFRVHQGSSSSSSVPAMMAFNFNFGTIGTKLPSAKKLCVITGTTSGLGKATLEALLDLGDYYVICACRDVNKMKNIGDKNGYDKSKYTVLELDLASFDSTRKFVAKLNALKKGRPVDRLVCNAAVYQPAFDRPRFTEDGFEEQLQINHLSHFLLCNLLLRDMAKAKDPRMIVVGSITGNDNTVGGGLVYPIANLGKLRQLEEAATQGRRPISMIDEEPFNGAKAYKDSKICNMMTINELHRRYHKSTGIVFSTMYPGCIAETQLFREKREWFRKLFPLFMKYVTGGYVSEKEAGQRLAQCVDDDRCAKSGVYWSWNGGAKTVAYTDFKGGLYGAGGAGGELFENQPSAKVRNERDSKKMWDFSTQIVGVTWPAISSRESVQV